jgi:hypothetical protein
LTDHWTASDLVAGHVRWSRRFGSPRTLDPGETVWLIGTAPRPGTIRVNGQHVASIAAGERFKIEIRSLLQPRNEVWIDLEAPGDTPLGEVVLEIRN